MQGHSQVSFTVQILRQNKHNKVRVQCMVSLFLLEIHQPYVSLPKLRTRRLRFIEASASINIIIRMRVCFAELRVPVLLHKKKPYNHLWS